MHNLPLFLRRIASCDPNLSEKGSTSDHLPVLFYVASTVVTAVEVAGNKSDEGAAFVNQKKKHERIANFQPINSEGLYIVLVEVTHLVVTKMRLESTRKKKSKFENASS